jgi:hypothetical protein
VAEDSAGTIPPGGWVRIATGDDPLRELERLLRL